MRQDESWSPSSSVSTLDFRRTSWSLGSGTVWSCGTRAAGPSTDQRCSVASPSSPRAPEALLDPASLLSSCDQRLSAASSEALTWVAG